MNKKEKQKRAFTLAEVLITLSIIGVVAAITMPVLINKINDIILSNQRKKAYSELARVLEEIRINEEFSLQYVGNNFKIIQSKFKVIKSCSNSRSQGCWTDTCQEHAQDDDFDKYCSRVSRTEAQNGKQANSVGFVDSSGRQWVHYKKESALWIIVDVNGDKKPNMMNKDRLFFHLCSSKTGPCLYDNRNYITTYIRNLTNITENW